MSKFIQMHILTFYPAANPNRDDTGRPKTAMIGASYRQRISSQCLKRTWRCSELFQEALSGHIGTRTKKMGEKVYKQLCDNGIAPKKAYEYTRQIAGQFGALKKEVKKKDSAKTEPNLTGIEIEQLVHISPEEWTAINQLTGKLIEEQRGPEDAELSLLRRENSAVDIAMFGRMLASSPGHNVEAALQVAHAFTVNNVTVEDDYFTAVDDLQDPSLGSGSAHLGNSEYGSGTFYKYICVDYAQLVKNLDNDINLATKAIRALGQCITTLTPSGKKNSFAHHARASFVLAEKGSQTPRSLALAFVNGVTAENQIGVAIERLKTQMENMDKIYGPCADSRCEFNVNTGEGSLTELLNFIGKE